MLPDPYIHPFNTTSQYDNGRIPKSTSSMISRVLLELPAEIRNNIYRHVLCYDGIKPEVKSNWSPWGVPNVRTRPSQTPHRMRQDSGSNLATERSVLRMQLNVIASVRKGFYPGVLPLVLASDIFNLLCVCRQIYEEAHAIFWAENAFIFSSQDTMHVFLHRIKVKSFALIRTLGIEKMVDAEPINLATGGIDIGFWYADVRIPPFLQPLHLYGWDTRFEEYFCLRDHWVANYSDHMELKIKKTMIQCKTTYNWLIWPSVSEVEPTKDTSGSTGDGSHSNWASISPRNSRCSCRFDNVRMLQ